MEYECADWKCFCSKADQVQSYPQNESISRCMVSSFETTNIIMLLSINSGSFTESIAFDSAVLKVLIKILLNEKVSPANKNQAINLLTKHRQLHPGCCASLTETYRRVILEPLDESSSLTLFQKIVQDLENLMQKDSSSVNARLSRSSRRKRPSENYYTEEDFQPRRRRTVVTAPVEILEDAENNPFFRFAALDFLTEIMKHEFVSKCFQSKDKDSYMSTIVGAIFLQFDGSDVTLNMNVIRQMLELYNCTASNVTNHKSVEKMVELISNFCLFADSGDLNVVTGNITCGKQYPLSRLFHDYFIQSVFKRTSCVEVIQILKNVKPEYLRLNCALSTLKRSGIKNLSSIVDKLTEICEELSIGDNDASSENADPNPIKTYKIEEKQYKKIFNKKLNEEVAINLLTIFGCYNSIYRLREMQFMENDLSSDESSLENHLCYVHSNYLKLKCTIRRIMQIENTPEYVKFLLYL